MLKALNNLPNSKGFELKIKDWIKGFGLAMLFFVSDSLPSIKEAMTAHDFGDYNTAAKVLFFVIAFLVQRWAKNNSK